MACSIAEPRNLSAALAHDPAKDWVWMTVVHLNADLQFRFLRRAAPRLLNLAICMLVPPADFVALERVPACR